MTKCVCNPGELSVECPVHGKQASDVAFAMLSQKGDVDNHTEARLNREIRETVRSITRMKEYKDKFTMKIPFEDPEQGEVWSVWFKVNNQHRWPLTPVPIKTKEEAEMLREQFARDLERVMEQMK
jgi:hypothetical protein